MDNHNIPKWVDLEQIGISSLINEKINEGFSSSTHFLLVWSKNAAKSEFVKKEYNAAISRDYNDKVEKIIIRLDDTPLPPLLADSKYHPVNEENLEVVLNKIFEKISIDKENQDNSERFDEYLDETFGDVVVSNHDYSTSYALKRIDPDLYKYEMNDWIHDEEMLDEFMEEELG